MLEKVQCFELHMCTRSWHESYPSLLSSTNLPSLSFLRSCSKLLLLYKILHGYLYFPPNIYSYSPQPQRLTCSFHPSNLVIPQFRTSSFSNSFVPSACSLWNFLPPTLKRFPSLSNFKFILEEIYTWYILFWAKGNHRIMAHIARSLLAFGYWVKKGLYK